MAAVPYRRSRRSGGGSVLLAGMGAWHALDDVRRLAFNVTARPLRRAGVGGPDDRTPLRERGCRTRILPARSSATAGTESSLAITIGLAFVAPYLKNRPKERPGRNPRPLAELRDRICLRGQYLCLSGQHRRQGSKHRRRAGVHAGAAQRRAFALPQLVIEKRRPPGKEAKHERRDLRSDGYPGTAHQA